ncbi:MAG: zinc-dependent peptidase [Verrucomicrobiales bacterium]
MIEHRLLISCLASGVCLIAWSVLLTSNRWRRFKQRRCELLNAPLSAEWDKILEKNFPLYGKMPEGIHRRLGGYVNAFVEGKNFEACGGLGTLTDEMLVTIAGQASMLLLNGKVGVFDALNSVLLYPGAYHAGSSITGKDSGG